jgi:hypothetical protein
MVLVFGDDSLRGLPVGSALRGQLLGRSCRQGPHRGSALRSRCANHGSIGRYADLAKLISRHCAFDLLTGDAHSRLNSVETRFARIDCETRFFIPDPLALHLNVSAT